MIFLNSATLLLLFPCCLDDGVDALAEVFVGDVCLDVGGDAELGGHPIGIIDGAGGETYAPAAW